MELLRSKVLQTMLLKYFGITDGLTIGAGAGEDNGEGSGASVDHTNIYVTYAADAFTVGYQTTESDSATANADKEDFTAIGVSYAMTDDLSISLNQSEIQYENTTLSDQEATGISVSYTMGSLSIESKPQLCG